MSASGKQLWRNDASQAPKNDGWIWCLSCHVYHQPGDPHLGQPGKPKVKRIWCLSCRRWEVPGEGHLL